MDILIFDMDGVLLQARGYHKALQDTVSLAANYLQIDGIKLSQEDIYKFEALGISSEWHSSALCMAFLEIQLRSGTMPSNLQLDPLFIALENESLHLPALQRGLNAITQLCKNFEVDHHKIHPRVAESESIEKSLTMNWFQELVLGSAAYQDRYHKQAQLNHASYLEKYDIPLISSRYAKQIVQWLEEAECGAAIMTNRPSSGPSGFSGSPEAEMGRSLVGLDKIPSIGYGEISWLAGTTSRSAGELAKPHPAHALAAIFSAIGIPREKSLQYAADDLSFRNSPLAYQLDGSTISVFEDTPTGVQAVQGAGVLLAALDLNVQIAAFGIARNRSKIKALESVGAVVYPDINSALSSLEDF